MKTKKMSNHKNGRVSAQALVAKAATAQRIAEAARKHLKRLKTEHRQARKAFKQAKKAAKRAAKEAKGAAKLLKPKNGAKTQPQNLNPIRRPRAAQTNPTVSRKTPGAPILLQANPAPVSASAATA